MAKAESTSIPIIEYVAGVTLTLTMFEAKVLSATCAKIGGSPTDSPRKQIEAISTALEPIVGETTANLAHLGATYRGDIIFDDYGTADA